MKRKEEKYEIPAGKASYLREEIARHLPLFEFRKGHPHTYITTVYLDTEELDLYNKARSYYDDNLKVRVKEYYYQNSDPRNSTNGSAPAPSWHVLDYCFLEIKERIGGLVVKRRFEVPKTLLGRLIHGEDVWDALVSSRNGIEFTGMVDVYREFRNFLKHFRVFPKSIINYRRSVYQKDEEELRITFDDEIAVFEPVPGLYERTGSLARSFLGLPRKLVDSIILEVKCQNGHPEWLVQLMENLSPKRFSKFTSSLSILTQELPRPVDGGPVTDLRAGAKGKGAQESGDTTEVSRIQL